MSFSPPVRNPIPMKRSAGTTTAYLLKALIGLPVGIYNVLGQCLLGHKEKQRLVVSKRAADSFITSARGLNDLYREILSQSFDPSDSEDMLVSISPWVEFWQSRSQLRWLLYRGYISHRAGFEPLGSLLSGCSRRMLRFSLSTLRSVIL